MTSIKNKQNVTTFDRFDVTNRTTFTTWSNDQCLAMLFIANTDQKKHGELISKLLNDYLLGNNNCPGSFADAFSLFLNFEPTGKIPTKTMNGGDDEQTKQQELIPGVTISQKSKSLVPVLDRIA